MEDVLTEASTDMMLASAGAGTIAVWDDDQKGRVRADAQGPHRVCAIHPRTYSGRSDGDGASPKVHWDEAPSSGL